jgi:WD40 repeat protein
MASVNRRAALSGHASTVTSVAWSPDGRRLVSTSGDRTVRLWNPDTGACVRNCLGGGLWPIRAVAFDLTGDRLVVASSLAVTVWHAETGQILDSSSRCGGAVLGVCS